jgi:hypothetical protein
MQPRTLLAAGISLLVAAVVLFAVVRLVYGERPAYVHVRWAPTVDEAAQEQAERTYHLTRVEFREQRTWLYILSDVSTDNIRQLVTSPAVEDTHYINRAKFTVWWTAERADYETASATRMAGILEFAMRISLLAGVVALVLGAYKAWQSRRVSTVRSAA